MQTWPPLSPPATPWRWLGLPRCLPVAHRDGCRCAARRACRCAARLWRLTPEQRQRFDAALDRWLKSSGSCRAARVAVHPCRSAVLLAGLRGQGHCPLRCLCRGRHRCTGHRPGRSVAGTGHRLQDGRARRTRRRNSCRRSTPCRRASTLMFCTRRAFEAVTVKFVRVEQADPDSLRRTRRTSSGHLQSLALR